MRLRRRMYLLFVLLVAVFAIGTFGFVVIEHWTAFDGFYMTLTTLTTIGYGETHPLSPRGRVFNVGLIVVGFTTLFALVGTFTEWVLQNELEVHFGQRRMERQLSKLKGHFIICGVGRVGRAVAAEFADAGAPFVIVDTSTERHAWAEERQALVVTGDATQEDVLRKAMVHEAKGLIAAVAGDAQNIYIALTARELNPKLTIVARASGEGAEKTLRRAGADIIISPDVYSGQRIAQALLRPNVVAFLDHVAGRAGGDLEASENLQMEELVVAKGSTFNGRAMREARTRLERGVIVVGLKKADRPLMFNPASDVSIEAGDCIIAIGERSSLKRLEAECEGSSR
jgi:voltage-gated potassium channel